MNNNDAEMIARFGLWYGGIFIEVLATVAIWVCCKVTTFRHTHIAERFAILTLLILGEGVMGYAIALQQSTPLSYCANKLSEELDSVLILSALSPWFA